MLIPILAGVVVLLVLFVIVVALRPADFRVSRSLAIAAPPETLFTRVNTTREWEAWNPWSKLDPKIKVTYDGPTAGVGASYLWAGTSRVGEGRSTIVESRPAEFVRFRLEFMRPMKATNAAEFIFQPEGPRTVVTWTMTGRQCFIGKAFNLVFNADKMLGNQFEKGLSTLKSLTETAPFR